MVPLATVTVSPLTPPVVVAAPVPAPVPMAVLVPPPPLPVHPLPVNPYLQPNPFSPEAAKPPQGVFFPAIAKTPSGASIPAILSVLPNGIEGLPDMPSLSSITTQLKNLVPVQLLGLLPVDDGESHWPVSFKTVYPTGEKPLWVLTLKCPTEAAFGVAPPPVKLVHVILTTAMDGINSTGLLPVNLQQVCR